jgi:hypothetical protein
VRLRQDPPPLNTARPLDVAAGERLEELRARQEKNDLVVALQKVEVRRVLFRVLDWTGIFQDGYQRDPHDHAYVAGRKSIGHQLWAAIDDVDEQAVPAMRADARTRIRQQLTELESMRTPSAEE